MTDNIFASYDDIEVDTDSLEHYGILRKSGRYPWGSGKTPNQRHRSFISYVDDLHKKGLSESEIARAIGENGISTTKLRALKAIAKNEIKASETSMALRLKEKGMSNIAIGERMGKNESYIRGLLDPSNQAKKDVLVSVANTVRNRVDKDGYIDIGKGNSNLLGISETKFNTAISMLEEDGYKVFNNVRVKQFGTSNQFTTVKVLAKPGTDFKDVMANVDNIKNIKAYSEDRGHTIKKQHYPTSLSSKRLQVIYAEDGGTDADGLMYIRPNAKDLSLGKSAYAQVRILVDGTHYLKGMAIYKDDLPDGVDIQFNTNKHNTGNKLDALKKAVPKEIDADNPFGSTFGAQHGHINIVNEEGSWEGWSRTLASQMLSKQRPQIARKQLDLYYQKKKDQYDEIMSLTNPVIRKKLLQSMADDLDSSAVSLKAAAIPKMASHVILPMKTMKETEIYAPNYHNGDKVVLIRYPHGGIFEIPELTVNNNHKEGSKLIGPKARDAVGINAKVAEQLSGADFDGDSVMVIPNNNGAIKTSKALKDLKDFDPKTAYPKYEGMKKIGKNEQQIQMGIVSNLITDMTLKGATNAELARAVKHSMVIIDAYKHELNYQQSKKDNDINGLHRKYQKAGGGASTIISRASSKQDVNDRRLRKASEGGSIDPKTGKKVYTYSGAHYYTGISTKTGKRIIIPEGQDYRVSKKTGEKEYVKPDSIEKEMKTVKSTKMAEADNAYSLLSKDPTEMEIIYADHANKMKALANETRKNILATPTLKYSPSAKIKYSDQVISLNDKLDMANKGKPLERQARIVANALVKQKIQADPDMDDDKRKKIEGQALAIARDRVGASKYRVDITPIEWEAIQAGAITNNKLTELIDNSDLDKVKELALPYKKGTMTSARISKARIMANNGHTRAEIAAALGVSVSTLSEALGTEGDV